MALSKAFGVAGFWATARLHTTTVLRKAAYNDAYIDSVTLIHTMDADL